MLIPYCLLLIMYISLTLCFLFTGKVQQPSLQPWPILSNVSLSQLDNKNDIPCRDDSDCPGTHVCLTSTCVRKLLRGGKCNSETGRWISYTHQNKATFAICSCLENQLVSQHFFGGDCNMPVACGVHGKYNEISKKCDCDPGYEAVAGYQCKKRPVMEQNLVGPCGPDEVQVSDIVDSDGFHAEYRASRLASVKCVKRPCTFDAFSGRPLKHGRYEPGWGCVCDPTFGLFGVQLETSNKTYLSSPGFDACASIYENDPQHPNHVEYITFFYLRKREPISIILFKNINENRLIPLLRGLPSAGNMMISQSLWRYDYAQYFFKTHSEFRARLRKATIVPIFQIEMYDEFHYTDYFKPTDCGQIHLMRTYVPLQGRVVAYKVLYDNPVCKVERDPKVDPMFHDRYVVNPQHMLYDKYNELHRFNAFVLRFDASVGVRRWTLDLDYPYRVDLFRQLENNAPDYS